VALGNILKKEGGKSKTRMGLVDGPCLNKRVWKTECGVGRPLQIRKKRKGEQTKRLILRSGKRRKGE